MHIVLACHCENIQRKKRPLPTPDPKALQASRKFEPNMKIIKKPSFDCLLLSGSRKEFKKTTAKSIREPEGTRKVK